MRYTCFVMLVSLDRSKRMYDSNHYANLAYIRKVNANNRTEAKEKIRSDIRALVSTITDNSILYVSVYIGMGNESERLSPCQWNVIKQDWVN